jgi:saccharopine dehydrogenase (NAD+, L-lysine-forming)
LSRPTTYGIVGGYGGTGRVVASELWKSTDAMILIAGRDLARASAIAKQFGSRVSPVQMDVLDSRSLDDFCSRCSTVVNCAGPVIVLQDRVAQAALRNRCHYVDGAGMSVVRERLLRHQREIEGLGLSFVVSAGWMPGISELLPIYADAIARTRMQAIESLTVYFADSGEWSDSALRDGAWYIHHRGLPSPGYFHRGEWTRAAASAAFRKVNLGDRVGAGRFCLFSTPEMMDLGKRFDQCDFSTYTYLSGMRNVLTTTMMAALPLPEGFSVRLLRNVFRRNQLPAGGFVVVEVAGRSNGSPQASTVKVTFEKCQDYWIHGVVLATAARLAANQGARMGVHFLADAVDPIGFMTVLRKAGVQQTEDFK